MSAQMRLSLCLILATALALPALESVHAAPPMPESLVELTVNGTTYQPGATIEVRVGERISVTAKVMGGRRAWCMHPETYANVGRRMVITSNGENGLSFTINAGQFRGDWKLTKERAEFTVGQGAKLSRTSDRDAELIFDDEGVGQTFFKVSVDASWQYVRKTPAGRTEKLEDQSATSSFTFKILKGEGSWYSSRNIVARGTEDFRVRGRLDYIQRFFNEIETHSKNGDFTKARRVMARLKVEVKALEEALRELKKKKPKSRCDVTIMGSPIGRVLGDIQTLKAMETKWTELAKISNANAQKINSLLLKTQMTFSGNVLRSVFKNYVSWGTSIPSGAEDVFTLYDPNNTLTPFDLPRKVMGWWEEANNDASILKNQTLSIKMLSELRKFYLQKLESSVAEKKAFRALLVKLKPAQRLATEWTTYIKGRRSIRAAP